MSKRTVLVVEDDEAMAAMLRQALERDFEVVVCTNKVKAIRKAKQYIMGGGRPDVVLLDLIVNGEGGLDFLNWLEAQDRRDTPIIFLTGCHPQSPEYKAAQATGHPIYEKDKFSSKELVSKIEAVVLGGGG